MMKMSLDSLGLSVRIEDFLLQRKTTGEMTARHAGDGYERLGSFANAQVTADDPFLAL